jgi:4-hydroxybenzoyl-CoA thioesterase
LTGRTKARLRPPANRAGPHRIVSKTLTLMGNLVHRRRFAIEWGHCDPAGIVFNSRFFEYFDWNTWLMFETALGVRPADLASTYNIIGIPLVDVSGRFMKPAKFNDVVEIASEINRFGRSSFDVKHLITVDGALAVEGSETRVWAASDPDDATKLKPLPIPAAVIDRFKAA